MRLSAHDLSVSLGGSAVLHGVSIECGPGRVTGLLGPNGAGKSTLIRTLAGLLPVASGRIEIDGVAIGRLTPAERGRRIAYLPQERTLHWPLAVRRVVALGRHAHARGEADTRAAEAIAAALRATDTVHLADRSVAGLSGGERARVLFARALAQEAPAILADEPTAGLDPAHALGLFEVLRRLAAEGRTLVVALHDLSLAARFCDDVVLLHDGRVAATGPPAETLTAGRLAHVFGVRMGVGVVDGVPAVVPVAPA
ncbi:MAG: ABC transporter ATP-binding protein [Hyphomicrobiaceae bacterium]